MVYNASHRPLSRSRLFEIRSRQSYLTTISTLSASYCLLIVLQFVMLTSTVLRSFICIYLTPFLALLSTLTDTFRFSYVCRYCWYLCSTFERPSNLTQTWQPDFGNVPNEFKTYRNVNKIY